MYIEGNEKINIKEVDEETKQLRSLLEKNTKLSEFEKLLAVKNLCSELDNQIAKCCFVRCVVKI